jgi:hypothetical protein
MKNDAKDAHTAGGGRTALLASETIQIWCSWFCVQFSSSPENFTFFSMWGWLAFLTADVIYLGLAKPGDK